MTSLDGVEGTEGVGGRLESNEHSFFDCFLRRRFLPRLRAVSFVVALASSLLVAFSAQAPPAPQKIASLIDRELKAFRVPGASYAIVAGDAVFTGSYGVADAERGTAMTAETLLQVGSLNKLMTALAVVTTLGERGLTANTAVGPFLPGVVPRLAETTFHELLSHSAGLRDRPGGEGTTDEAALTAGVKTMTAGDFLLPRGVVFSYSNPGYAAAGAALEHLRKTRFPDALRESVFEPLEMRSTFLRPSDGDKHPRARGHRLEPSRVATLATTDLDTSLWPAGYLWTNASDLSRVVAALLKHPVPTTHLQRAFAAVTTPHVSMPNVFVGGHYGYGMMLGTDRGARIYEHGGTQTGFSSLLRVAPERNLGLAILTNLDNAPLRRVAQMVMAEALELLPLSTTRSEASVTADEMQSLAGIYRNRSTAEVAVRDGHVVLMLDQGPPMAVTRIGTNRYLARPKPEVPGPEFVLQPATASVPAYLHFGLWAHVR